MSRLFSDIKSKGILETKIENVTTLMLHDDHSSHEDQYQLFRKKTIDDIKRGPVYAFSFA